MKRTFGMIGLATVTLLWGCSTQGEPVREPQEQRVVVSVDPQTLQESFRQVAAASLPSVVRIDVEQVRRQVTPEGGDVPWFDFFFGPPDEDGDSEREFRTQGLGSGVIVEERDGVFYVLTNAHVLGDAESVNVTLDDGTSYNAEIVGSDERKDLALVAFETEDDMVVATLGDSDTLFVGDWVLAIGSPFGFQSTVTAGIVSALGRRGGPDGNISDFIQTDAAINRGNSGGALVNLNGEVVGINTWISSQTGGSVGLGFSIPINNAKRAIDDFISTGTVRYGWLGVSIRPASPDTAQALDLPNRRGALVHHVFQGSPADVGGLLPGDFIRAVNDEQVDSSDAVVLAVGELPVGERAAFEVIRYGEEITVDVTIAERMSEREISQQNFSLWPGFSVYPLTEDIRKDLDLSRRIKGVLVATVEARTPATDAGIQVGDVVTAVNGVAVEEMIEFYHRLNAVDGNREITLVRDGDERIVTVEE